MSNENNSVPTQVYDPASANSADENRSENSVFKTIEIVGTVLENRYLIQNKIGDGGFGSVFLALDRRLVDKPVVVKVLERLENEWINQKFQQEREALSRIEHSGIVGILDSGTLNNGKPFIVMQYVDGITLREVIKEGDLSVERIGNITEQIATALSAAHQKNILHRDLKPENIMLQKGIGGKEIVKIIDFGIAKVAESKIAESTVGIVSAGTLFYLPPETLQGQTYTESSEVYVLGMLVYEMLTGFRPFKPDTENPLLFPPMLLDLQKEGFSSPRLVRPDLPAEAERVLSKALAFEESNRYKNAAEFGGDFVRALQNKVETPDATQFFVPSAPSIEIETPAPGEPAFLIDDEIDQAALTPKKKSYKKSRDILLLTAGFIVILSVGLFAVWYLYQNTSPEKDAAVAPAAAKPVEEVSLNYWLEVQKVRDGKAYQEPFKSSGQEIFENGYEFKINFKSEKPGYLYFYNIGTEKEKGNYWILFPTPVRNDGAAKVEADRTVESGWNVFGGEAGTENFWLIWSEDKLETLEDARENAFEGDDGSIGDEDVKKKFEEFIDSNSNQTNTVEKQDVNKETVIKGAGKIIVQKIKMEHR